MSKDLRLISTGELKSCFPKLGASSHKGGRGRLVLLGGSSMSVGAPLLAENAAGIVDGGYAAMRSGVGLTTLAVPQFLLPFVFERVMFSTIHALPSVDGKTLDFDTRDAEEIFASASAAAIGFGAGRGATSDYIDFCLEKTDLKILVDADALNNLSACTAKQFQCGEAFDASSERDASNAGISNAATSNFKISNAGTSNTYTSKDGRMLNDFCNFRGRTVLTPHPKEFSRLSGRSLDEIFSNPAGVVSKFAKHFNCTVLLKGAFGDNISSFEKDFERLGIHLENLDLSPSIISDGTDTIVNMTGGPALAKGGSGDVLSGIIGALLARGIRPLIAAATGAWVAGRAAELSGVNEYSHMPTDTIKNIPAAIDEILRM